VIGLVQSLFWLLLSYFNWPNISITLISISIGILITGGIHIDGLMDTADGIGAGPSKRIKAMKDSRVGAIGVQSLLIIFSFQIAAIIKLDFFAPVVFPFAAFWGRFSQIIAIENYEYISNKHSKYFHQKNWKGIFREIRPSLLIICIGIIFFLFLLRTNLSIFLSIIFYVPLGLIASITVPYFINRSLGGHNGDSYGASLVITETIIFMVLSVIFVPN